MCQCCTKESLVNRGSALFLNPWTILFPQILFHANLDFLTNYKIIISWLLLDFQLQFSLQSQDAVQCCIVCT